RRLEQRAADIVDHDVDAFAAGDCLDLVGKVLAAPGDHNLVGASLADQVRLARGGGEADREGTCRTGQLYAVNAQTAAGASHQAPVAELDMGDVTHRIQFGADHAGDDRGFLQGDPLRHMGDIGFLDADIFGIAAVQAPVTEELALV